MSKTHLPTVVYKDLGRVPYEEAWDYQTVLHQELIERKRAIWKGVPNEIPPQHTFILCEHPPVFTLGKSGKEDHLKIDESLLEEKGFTFFKINRGGDITYHGPGQIVGYPILDLEDFYCDIHRYVRELEEVIIRVINHYGLEGERVKDYTGVWLAPNASKPWRKICAIGVHMSRWVSLHGFAFNVHTDLTHFEHIIPCGIQDGDKSVTSLAKELDHEINMEEVKAHVLNEFENVFHCQIMRRTPC